MAKNWKRTNYSNTGPVSDPDIIEEENRKPTVTGAIKVPGGNATDMKVAGQNTKQTGTGGESRQRNFLGRRVT